MLNATAKTMAAAPHFSNRAWPRIDRKHVGQVYRAYFVVPYFIPIENEMMQIAGEPFAGLEPFVN
jgi:hypothetical protein